MGHPNGTFSLFESSLFVFKQTLKLSCHGKKQLKQMNGIVWKTHRHVNDISCTHLYPHKRAANSASRPHHDMRLNDLWFLLLLFLSAARFCWSSVDVYVDDKNKTNQKSEPRPTAKLKATPNSKQTSENQTMNTTKTIE